MRHAAPSSTRLRPPATSSVLASMMLLSMTAPMGCTSVGSDGYALSATPPLPAPPAPPRTASAAIRRCLSSGEYSVGAARTDITGPMTDISAGYSTPTVMMKGLAMRLYARAFVIESPCSRQRIAYVNVDVLHMYQSIKTGVAARVARRLPGVYDTTNVLIAGTHDHAAPSNVSARTLYDLANGVIGFDQLNYDIIVDGIVDAIVRAHGNRRPATITVARGRLPGGGHNRSAGPYAANPEANQYDSNVDDAMTLLRFTGTDGTPIGALNWFAVHGCSLDESVRLVHGDNKGYAAYRMEQDVSRATGVDFVAGFSNSNMGDVSPNQPNPADPTGRFQRPSDLDPSLDIYDNARIHGMRQYELAMQLYANATERVHGGVFYKHRFVEFQDLRVDPAYGAVAGARTCDAAMGAAFFAGTEENLGEAISFLAEGKLVYNGRAINPLIAPDLQTCHAEKQVVLPIGDVSNWWVDDTPWVDTIVPFQIITIGNVAVVGSSFEQTTMAGRRIRRVLLPTLSKMGVTDVAIATLANAYNMYMTTREEYALQNYEGGSTHFGPWSSAAFLEQSDTVARALVQGRWLSAGPTPPDLLSQPLTHTWIDGVGVVDDDAPSGSVLGGIVTDALPSYTHGSAGRVTVTFWSAHPRTALIRQRAGAVPPTYSYFDVQRQVGGAWTTVANDRDEYTRFSWTRIGGDLSPESQLTVEWDLDVAEPGTYRIVHHGIAKHSVAGLLPTYESFDGTSSAFVVR